MKTSSIFPSRYLRASDLNGKPVEVIIEDIVMEIIGDKDAPVAVLKNMSKILVLNKTNLHTLEEIGGEETDDWRGLRIVLYPTRVDFQGKRVDAIRIKRPDKPNNDGGRRGGDVDNLAF